LQPLKALSDQAGTIPIPNARALSSFLSYYQLDQESTARHAGSLAGGSEEEGKQTTHGKPRKAIE